MRRQTGQGKAGVPIAVANKGGELWHNERLLTFAPAPEMWGLARKGLSTVLCKGTQGTYHESPRALGPIQVVKAPNIRRHQRTTGNIVPQLPHHRPHTIVHNVLG